MSEAEKQHEAKRMQLVEMQHEATKTVRVRVCVHVCVHVCVRLCMCCPVGTAESGLCGTWPSLTFLVRLRNGWPRLHQHGVPPGVDGATETTRGRTGPKARGGARGGCGEAQERTRTRGAPQQCHRLPCICCACAVAREGRRKDRHGDLGGAETICRRAITPAAKWYSNGPTASQCGHACSVYPHQSAAALAAATAAQEDAAAARIKEAEDAAAKRTAQLEKELSARTEEHQRKEEELRQAKEESLAATKEHLTEALGACCWSFKPLRYPAWVVMMQAGRRARGDEPCTASSEKRVKWG